MPAARFVRPLSEHEQFALHQHYRTTHDADLRSRTQMILLSAAGQPVAQIASLNFFGEDTVRGSQRKVATPGQNQKRYGFGAVNMISGAVTQRIEERKTSVGFCALVEQVAAEYCPGERWDGPKVVLGRDNASMHRSTATQRVLERYADRLIICPPANLRSEAERDRVVVEVAAAQGHTITCVNRWQR